MYEKQPIMVISVCDARDLLSLPLCNMYMQCMVKSRVAPTLFGKSGMQFEDDKDENRE